MMFEYLHQGEAEFLYEEVFVRRTYLQHGLVAKEGAVIVDAGANIGLFSLQCLREASGVQVYAFEPIPAIYDVLVRNLNNNASDIIKGRSCPKPIILRVALGAEQAEEEFHFFGDNPGESTRHLEERGKQLQALNSDVDAASWRQVLEGENPKDAGPAAAGGAVKREHAEGKNESFFCNVVPLSLALDQLGISTVDLLKVDVEGDELAVLHGIDDEDWPKIRQVALEVHDVDGRLAATVDLLKSEPAAFDEVCWEPQVTSEVKGYVMVVPSALKMFLVFAKRSPRGQSSKTSSIDDGPATGLSARGEEDLCCGAVRGVEPETDAARTPAVIGGEVEGGKGAAPLGQGMDAERFCSCAPHSLSSQGKHP
ncbi:unnamed protein product [Scytosiphon promiscuus]